MVLLATLCEWQGQAALVLSCQAVPTYVEGLSDTSIELIYLPCHRGIGNDPTDQLAGELSRAAMWAGCLSRGYLIPTVVQGFSLDFFRFQ